MYSESSSHISNTNENLEQHAQETEPEPSIEPERPKETEIISQIGKNAIKTVEDHIVLGYD